MEDELRISKEFLDKTVDGHARILVGVIMKRFEAFSDITVIKSSIKELIYENSRTLKATLESFSNGVRFISKPKNGKKS